VDTGCVLSGGTLETLSADTDTITIDAEKVPLLLAKAREIFWKREAAPASANDKASLKPNMQGR